MRTIKEFIFTANFRHIFAVLILIAFMIVTTLPFWIGSTGLSQNSWTYLTSAQGAITVLLTLAGRRYFDNKTETKNEQKTDTENQGQPFPIIPNVNGDNCRNNPCPNPSCGMQSPTSK